MFHIIPSILYVDIDFKHNKIGEFINQISIRNTR